MREGVFIKRFFLSPLPHPFYSFKIQHYSTKNYSPAWKTKKILPNEQTFLISEIIVSPVYIIVNFEFPRETQGEQNFAVYYLKNVFGSTFGQISNAPLKLSGIRLPKSCHPVGFWLVYDVYLSVLMSHLKHQVLKIVASLSLLGSPQELVNEVVNGIKELEEDGLVSGSG